MKMFAALSLASALLATSHAQLSTIPPSSLDDGIVMMAGTSAPARLAAWTASGLWNYRSANTAVSALAGSTDIYGNTWTTQGPATTGLAAGGYLQVIALGSSSSAVNAFGYSYANSIAADKAFTFATLSGTCPPSDLHFGDFALLPFAAGDVMTFNLWCGNIVSSYGLFHSLTGSTGEGGGTVTWTQSPLLVPTIPLIGFPDAPAAEIPTWIVNIKDGSGDFRFAVQLYGTSAAPAAVVTTPVPEPATFALAGVAGLLGLAAHRRLRRS